jgi:hypothetical protein
MSTEKTASEEDDAGRKDLKSCWRHIILWISQMVGSNMDAPLFTDAEGRASGESNELKG